MLTSNAAEAHSKTSQKTNHLEKISLQVASIQQLLLLTVKLRSKQLFLQTESSLASHNNFGTCLGYIG